jgi:hypothetical protein
MYFLRAMLDRQILNRFCKVSDAEPELLNFDHQSFTWGPVYVFHGIKTLESGNIV